MSEANIPRRGFLGHILGAATMATIVPATLVTAEERRQKAEEDLIAALLELNPGGEVRKVRFNDLTMVKIHVA